MAVNRMIFFATLIVSLVFYFASRTWFSWIVLLLVLALPLLSLLLSLPSMLSSRLEAALPPRAEQGEACILRLNLRSLACFPLPDARVRINLRTRSTDRDVRYLSRVSRTNGVLPLSTDECGYLAPVFEKAQVFDALGLFSLPLRRPSVAPMAILPPAVRPARMPDLTQLLHLQFKAKPGGGFAEAHDHRPYRPGDPVKDIHWKLSLKTEDLIVREPLEPIRRKIVLAACTARSADRLALTAGALRYLSLDLLGRELPHTVVWMEGNRLAEAAIETEEDVTGAVARICCADPKSADLPSELSLAADWICRVGEEVV